MALTDSECLDLAETALNAMLDEWAQNVGGYPGFACTRIPGYTLMVQPNEGEPSLRIYRNRTVVRWYRKALRFLRDYPDEDMGTALAETWPKREEEF